MVRQVALGIIIVVGLVGGWLWWQGQQPQSADGIVSGNGRIEADQVDIASKYTGRVQEILVHEGDMVQPGQVLAKMDTAELDAEIDKAKAQLAEAEAAIKQAEAEIVQRQSEHTLAQQELTRAMPLVRRGSLSKRTLDQRQSQRDAAVAAVNAAKANLVTKNRAVDAARAGIKQVQTKIDDSLLRTPVVGRVLYRLAQEGEVLAAGGKVLTLIDLSEVYMEIFLPSQEAARLAIGAEARIVLDAAASEFAVPAIVSFVAPEAQFTPKQVETRSEREKLMFRIKVKIPHELVIKHIEKVKTGVRGVAYVRLDDTVAWPEALEKRYPGDPK
ncbi:HlyD family secretion protein [Nitrosomonas aestuarii]|uniref:HlyD family secretion protein n=1 Tax=Nitrosomonas aestuarii TaxID=52441 RepID=A0A1I4HBN3_9PROT|nr:HlyD family efflux transporter periplasmic adaptor subunit [Nitrosomonas aestuarii]SFL39702.1 HlyD family secretion protein [Nitrosomonas aestuarii]